MRYYTLVIIISVSFTKGQPSTGNDLLSDLENSNKNAVYTYWIGIVNGNVQGFEFGIWYTLNQLETLNMIDNDQKGRIFEELRVELPQDQNEEDIFKTVWRNLRKNPEKRHMYLSELIHLALSEK